MTRVSGPTLSPDVLGGAPEALVQTALIAGGIGLWEWHVGTRQLALSPHLETLLGYPPGGFDGEAETFLARLVHVDRLRVEQAIAAAIAEGNETDLELRVVDLTGVARWFAAKGRVLRDAAGKAVRIVGTMQEVPATVIAERRMHRQQAGLLRLLADDRITQCPLDEAFRLITEVAGRTLEIERTSVWLFTPDRAHLRCHNLYRRSLLQHMAGATLDAAAYPAYFRALESGRAVAATDAHRDPRTAQLVADYLVPLGIGAMLEAPVRHEGRLVGVVCHEHVGPPRQWLLDEKTFAASIADLVAMVLDAEARRSLAARLVTSEERYRTFVNLSTEGILRVEITPPVPTDAPVAEQVAHIRRHGVVAEANPAVARLIGAAAPERLVGRTIESLIRPDAAEKLLAAWIRAGYRFSEYEVDVLDAEGRTLWLLGSMIAVVTDGHLAALWSTWRNITRRKEAVSALEFQARHDPLTGLPNRKWLAERLADAAEEARRAGDGLALMMMDLDHFKEINDALGHFAGDQLLKLIGPRLAPLLAARGGELARLGGDEFAVIVRGCRDSRAALAVAGEMIASLREPFEVGQLKLGIDASVGAAIAPAHGFDSSTLMRCADVAMYEAKRKGLHTAVYDPALDRYSPRRLALANALGEAVRAGQVHVEYQPVARLADRSVDCVEALARWRHPQYGDVAPDEFVPLAEMGDHIRSLTLKVLGEAARQWNLWRGRGLRLRIAVNLSTRVLIDQGFVAETRGVLERHGVPGDAMIFEITESAMLVDATRAVETIERLHTLGIGFSVDDFGIGFSSLAYLKQLPLESLKIDRSFVAGMTANVRDASIVRSTINLAHDLGLRVVAEGVETADALAMIARLGCDAAQGFYIARPQAGAALAAWLEGGGWQAGVSPG
jgi:diguanylate cyclase (GGDEF)-like protein/PAS domain S-box-containing protein